MEFILWSVLAIVWVLGSLGAWTIGVGFGGPQPDGKELFFNVILPAIFWPFVALFIVLASLWRAVRGG